MRTWIAVFGVLILVGGAILVAVPIEPQNLPVNTQSSTDIEGVEVNSPLMEQSFAISWSANTTGSLYYAVCDSLTSPQETNHVSCSTDGVQTGTSGTISLTATNDKYIVLEFLGKSGVGSASASAKSTVPTAGIIVIVVGLIVVIIGALGKKHMGQRAVESKEEGNKEKAGPTSSEPKEESGDSASSTSKD